MTAKDLKLIKPGEVRVRIAPSPTGYLHIGLARAALFNYLFAKQNQGSFILRIEDTDLERSSPEFEKDIIESLKWLGLEWSEGPETAGEYGPYRQSERLSSYKGYLEKLMAEDKVYHCFCSEQDLEDKRQYQMSIGQAPKYSGDCANLPKETVKKYLTEGKASILRFRTPFKKLHFDDLIRGRLDFDTSLIGDIVIAKNLDTPLYNLAVVVDDHEMKITHVIRGEDHISNTPKQILIQEALGIKKPIYAHLPLVLGPDRSKLSKRHSAISVSIYRKEGYLPEALINFMSFLGWNPGDEREIYSLPSLIKEFSLERIQKGGAIFNFKRLNYLNGFYIRQKSKERLTELCIPYLIEAGLIKKVKEGINLSKSKTAKTLFDEGGEAEYAVKETKEGISFESLVSIVSIYQERLKKLSEIIELTDFLFKKNLKYHKNLLKWEEMPDKEIKNSLLKAEKIMLKIKNGDWTKEVLENKIMPEAEKMGNRGKLLWPLRVALTGKEASASPFEIADILGKEKALKRIDEAKKLI